MVTLIVPNIVMDGIQAARCGGFLATVRRLGVMLVFGAMGTIVGTQWLVLLPARVATLTLGVFVLAFVALNVTRVSPRVAPAWEAWLAGPVGFAAGVVGGITNVPGTPLVMYYYALGMGKDEFVRSVAFSFMLYKIVQLGAVTYYGLLTVHLLGVSLALTGVALIGFVLGLRVQDRLDQAVFNRAVLVFLALLGAWLVAAP